MKEKTYAALKALPESELIKEFDRAFQNSEGGLNFLRDELAHREAEQQYKQMHAMTEMVTRLTYVMTGIAAIQLIFAVLQTYLTYSQSK